MVLVVTKFLEKVFISKGLFYWFRVLLQCALPLALFSGGGGGGATLPRDRGVEKLYGVPTVGLPPQGLDEVKNGRSGAKDGAPERLRCGTFQEEVSQILQRLYAGAATRILPFYSA